MEDRELLELAALAAPGIAAGDVLWDMGREKEWVPLTDDGDALRLAVKLGLMVDVCHDANSVSAIPDPSQSFLGAKEQYDGDPYAATRRAIVRAAAEIGKRIKEQK